MTGLTNGTTYLFRVLAANTSGSGPWSTISAAYTPNKTVPGAPTGVGVSNALSWSVDLSWTAPADNGGLAIDRYAVHASTDGGKTWSLSGHPRPTLATTWTWTGLTPNTTYVFQLFAHNSLGWSKPSTTSAAIKTAP